MTFPNFSAGQIELFFLVLIRVSTIVVLIPILGDRTTPARIKGGLAVLITFLVLPSVSRPESPAEDPLMLGMRMGGEVLIGVALAFASRIAFSGIQMAGQLIGFQVGFSIVNIIDPLTSEQVSIIAELQYLFAGLLFLAVNGHHMLIQAVSESYSVLPVLGFHMTGELAQGIIEQSRSLFVIAVKISAPIVVAVLFTNVGLGLVARTVPQINVFIVGFPLQIAIGLIGIGLSIPLFLQIVAGLFSNLPAEMNLMLRAM